MDKTEVPSRASIVVGMVATGAALISTAYIGIGLWSMREVAGFVLGLVASLLLLGQTVARITRRADLLMERVRDQAGLTRSPEFRRFVPAAMPPPDVTARIYREAECPTEVIQLGPLNRRDPWRGYR